MSSHFLWNFFRHDLAIFTNTAFLVGGNVFTNLLSLSIGRRSVIKTGPDCDMIFRGAAPFFQTGDEGYTICTCHCWQSLVSGHLGNKDLYFTAYGQGQPNFLPR